jgi:hypothetical protein
LRSRRRSSSRKRSWRLLLLLLAELPQLDQLDAIIISLLPDGLPPGISGEMIPTSTPTPPPA